MNNKAFTLIELLVVISIIGVISSIVFVSFSGSREKARLAKAQQFDAQVSHALGAYAVGIWRFENISGGKVSDESGYDNDGTIHGDPVLVDSEIYPGTKALKFDGNDYVDCNDKILLDAFNTSGTIEFWVYPNSDWNDGSNHFLVYPSGAWGYVYKDWSGNALTATIGGLQAKKNMTWKIKWYHLVVIWEGLSTGNATVKIYVDGSFFVSRTGSPSAVSASNIRIGSSSSSINGIVDDVRIYNEPLSIGQIQQHYVAGAASHGIAVNQ